MKVTVKDGQVDHANRLLKKRLQRSGFFEYVQKHKHHITNPEKKAEKLANRLKAIYKFEKNRKKRDG